MPALAATCRPGWWCSRCVGRVRVPGPIAAMVNRNERPAYQLPYAWNPKYPARIGVMPREGGNGDVRWFDIEPCYVYHPLNAYSEVRDGNEVLVLDVVRYQRMFDRDRRGPGESSPTLDRWTINLATGVVSSERRDDRAQEFPRINETQARRPASFRLHRGYRRRLPRLRQNANVDIAVQAGLHHRIQHGGPARSRAADRRNVLRAASPPPRRTLAEDDGILIGYGYHRGRDEGQLVLLDAQTCESVATVHLPQRVPMGFHGNWAPRQ